LLAGRQPVGSSMSRWRQGAVLDADARAHLCVCVKALLVLCSAPTSAHPGLVIKGFGVMPSDLRPMLVRSLEWFQLNPDQETASEDPLGSSGLVNPSVSLVLQPCLMCWLGVSGTVCSNFVLKGLHSVSSKAWPLHRPWTSQPVQTAPYYVCNGL